VQAYQATAGLRPRPTRLRPKHTVLNQDQDCNLSTNKVF